jgi:hypothetical protein
VTTVLPRRFALVRHIDYTGVSGIGVVAYGITFSDGQVALRWCSSHPATSIWESLEHMLAVHGHGEATSIQWIDAPVRDLEELPGTSGTGRRARRRAAVRASQSAGTIAAIDPSNVGARPASPSEAAEAGGDAVARSEGAEPVDDVGAVGRSRSGFFNGHPRQPGSASDPTVDTQPGAARDSGTVPGPPVPGRPRRSDQEVPR